MACSGFADDCVRGLPGKIRVGSSQVAADWHYGIGLILLVVATGFKLVDAAIHCVIKTPKIITLTKSERIAANKKLTKASDMEMPSQ